MISVVFIEKSQSSEMFSRLGLDLDACSRKAKIIMT